MTKEQAKEKISQLIKDYEKLATGGKLEGYNEANTRKDFIMPLFEALGWEIRKAEEVSEEEAANNRQKINIDHESDEGLLTSAGWYWWPCFPGCLPDGDAEGPFDTGEEAQEDAQDTE